jgi:hypothetical protein
MEVVMNKNVRNKVEITELNAPVVVKPLPDNTEMVKLFGRDRGSVLVETFDYELIELNHKDEFVYNDLVWVVATPIVSEKIQCFCYSSVQVLDLDNEISVRKVVK